MVYSAVSSRKFLVLMRDIQFLQTLRKTTGPVVNVILVSISTIDETEAQRFERLMVQFKHVERIKCEPSRPSVLVHLTRFEIDG